MSKLDVSNNDMFGYGDGRGMIEFAAALKDNLVLTELNLASNDIKAKDAQLLSAGLSGNGTLTNFTFGGDDNSKSVTMETTMTVADFSGKHLGLSGAIMLSSFFPKCT
jgi:hypothetical protein